MKKSIAVFVALAVLFPIALAQGQVDTAEILGVEVTLPHSRDLSGWQLDDSVGEARIVVQALDSEGNPVAGAPVEWRLHNNASELAYVVDASGIDDFDTRSVYTTHDQLVRNVTTDEDGRAYIVLDSNTAGDVAVSATVGGVEASGYGGRSMRVVWF